MITALTRTRRFSNIYMWWALALTLYGLMMFGPLRTLTDLAAVPPFDLRPMGYSFDDARDLMNALGQRGRDIYMYQQLVLDTFYPMALAVASVLTLRRFSDRAKANGHSRRVLLCKVAACVAITAAGFDYIENILIAAILIEPDAISSFLVTAASTATRVKSLATTFSLGTVTVLVIFSIAKATFHDFKPISWQQR
ncbi:MAG: hypothetical protein ABF285_13690 [Pacificibacter sp.]|jgi:hypothetical protein|uniref:hypothetical protein n=1 Tax=Pacificibacter sp. TaxID=1917866 RepID=UPI00321A5FC1